MSNMDLIKGITIGAVAGATIGMAVVPRRRSAKSVTGRALKAAGEIMENITDAMGK